MAFLRFILAGALTLILAGTSFVSAQSCTIPAGNKIINPSFETNTSPEWVYSGSSNGGFGRSTGYQRCGSYYGLLQTWSSGIKKVYQDVAITEGSKVAFSVWAGIHARSNQKIRLVFLNASGNEMAAGQQSVEVYKEVNSRTGGASLQLYELNSTAPQGAKKVRIEGSVSHSNPNGNYYYLKLEMALLLVEEPSLPVVLSGINVGAEGKSARVSWSTTEEANAEGFEVLHSRDGKKWDALGVVAARGDHEGLAHYTFVHSAPAAGVNLYRLRMFDLDGTSELSRMVSISLREGQEDKPFLYPNPSRGEVTVSFNSSVSGMRVFDGLGREVLNVKKDGAVDMSHLPAGNYIARFEGAGGYTSVQRIRIGL